MLLCSLVRRVSTSGTVEIEARLAKDWRLECTLPKTSVSHVACNALSVL